MTQYLCQAGSHLGKSYPINKPINSLTLWKQSIMETVTGVCISCPLKYMTQQTTRSLSGPRAPCWPECHQLPKQTVLIKGRCTVWTITYLLIQIHTFAVADAWASLLAVLEPFSFDGDSLSCVKTETKITNSSILVHFIYQGIWLVCY